MTETVREKKMTSGVKFPCDGTHPAARLYPLVHVIGERLAADVAPTALSGVKIAVLQHDLALADDHHRTSTHLSALKDVILYSLVETIRAQFKS